MSNKNNTLTNIKFYDLLDKVLPGQFSEIADGNDKHRIFFSHISIDGLSEFHDYSTRDDRFYRYLEYEPFSTIEESREYIMRLLHLEGKDAMGRTAKAWFINDIKTNKIIGSARLINIDFHRQSVMWGYGLDPNFWGQGYALEIQNILKEYIFETLSLNRLYGTAMITNKSTISTLIAYGMQEEGIERQSMRDTAGKYYDAWRYSMLSEDYFCAKNDEFVPNINNIMQFDEDHFRNIITMIIKDGSPITDELIMSDVQSWDSLMQMELITALETEYEISLTFNEIVGMKSIKDIKDLMKIKIS